jgi:DNA repair protein SbcD/Mre11
MKKFLHLADIHLGNQQYGLSERFNDFGEAFLNAVDFAIDQKVNFVLICGDLFDKTRMDPPTLIQALEGLQKLQSNGVRTIAIGGNHDKTRYQEGVSWLDFLTEMEYLYLLSPEFTEDGFHLPPWDGKYGAYVDIDGIRIYGLPWLGASAETILEEYPKLLSSQKGDGVDFTILMGHFGMDGQLPGVLGGLSANLISKLEDKVDYLALGHWHKPFENEGWIFNPGSLECCGMNERDFQGGYYLVTINDKDHHKFTAQHIPSKKRLFHRIVFQVDGYKTPSDLMNYLSQRLLAEKPKLKNETKPPIIEVVLEGIMAFDRQQLDLEQIRTMITEILAPVLYAHPVNNTKSTRFEIKNEKSLPRAELEQHVLHELVMSDSRFSGHADEWVATAIEIKELANAKSSAETIIKSLRKSVEKVDWEE